MKFWIYIFIFVSISANAQSDVKDIRLKFQKIEHMPYLCEGWFEIGKFGCGDSLFWEVTTQKESAIMALMELLNDTSHTQVYFPNYGGLMTVADIAQISLGEIIQPLPRPNDFIKIDEMDGSQWMANIHWLQISPKNRQTYKESITDWYKKNKTRLVWNSSSRFRCGDLQGSHPNKGHFILKDI